MRLLKFSIVIAGASAKECHPMDLDHPKAGDLYNCHRECDAATEWCMQNPSSSTGWACGPKHKRDEAKPGEFCVAGGDVVFCSNCPSGYFCQNVSNHWECDVLSSGAKSSVTDVMECHPSDPSSPKPGDLFNCHRECDAATEWCVPNTYSSTGWACGAKHHRSEAQPGKACIAGGGTVFCSNCPDGYFCQNESNHWECDVMASETPKTVVV